MFSRVNGKHREKIGYDLSDRPYNGRQAATVNEDNVKMVVALIKTMEETLL